MLYGSMHYPSDFGSTSYIIVILCGVAIVVLLGLIADLVLLKEPHENFLSIGQNEYSIIS